MALIFKSRVRESSTTTGTAALALAGAVTDHRAFASVMSLGDTCWYTAVNPGAGEWEIGLGTYSATNTLTRTTVYESSNSDLAVNFSAGAKDVFIDQSAAKLGSTESLQANAVTTPKIADLNVTNGKLAAHAVSQDKVDSTVWRVGNARLTLDSTTASPGWLFMDDATIGDGSSGAVHANAVFQALFNVIYVCVGDGDAPLLTSTGGATTRAGQGTAAAAWAAHCRITLPKQLGRALCIAGNGAGLTGRNTGSTFGEETHTLTLAEAPTGQFTMADGTHAHSYSVSGNNNTLVGGGTADGVNTGLSTTSTGSASSNITLTDHAGGNPHNNMQPSTFWLIEIYYGG
jgi:hypothetical protein